MQTPQSRIELITRLKEEMISRWGGQVALSGAFLDVCKSNAHEVQSLNSLWKMLRPGSLSEISGPWGGGKTEWVIRGLASSGEGHAPIAWIQTSFKSGAMYPLALPQFSLPLERVLFIELESETLGALGVAAQVLRSQLFSTLVFEFEGGSEVQLKRLQLEAERAAARVLLLSSAPRERGLWTLGTQLAVRREPLTGEVQVEVLKGNGVRKQNQTPQRRNVWKSESSLHSGWALNSGAKKILTSA